MPIKLDTWGQFVFIMADPSRCAASLNTPCHAACICQVQTLSHNPSLVSSNVIVPLYLLQMRLLKRAQTPAKC